MLLDTFTIHTIIQYSDKDIVIKWRIQVNDEELFLLKFPTHASPGTRIGEVRVLYTNQKVRPLNTVSIVSYMPN
jgi:hypothetical protein